MILLLGGTSETAPLAAALTEAGRDVLVSTATAVPLDLPERPGVHRRVGPLDRDGMLRLIGAEKLEAVVDATHPYAVEVTETAREAASLAEVPYFRLTRPEAVRAEDALHRARDHGEAASLACSFGEKILLTTGSRNLGPYVREARRTDRELFVRVLPNEDSVRACQEAGIDEGHVIAARGPFGIEQNRETIRRLGIGVLVTKDSGLEGGVPEKIAAAAQEKCEVVLVERPRQAQVNAFARIEELVAAVVERLGP